MCGRAAIRESMQLELIDQPETKDVGKHTIAIDSIDGVRVQSHPIDRMLEDSDQSVSGIALANYVPDDRFFGWFRIIVSFK